ncbi:MAG: histidinol dehydrogenase, partial [Chthonomonadaceae bacterium]|nr:histidinol dehydrogenase [Chthonomonadaceae bacterium]
MRFISVERDGYRVAAKAVTRTNLQDNPKVEAIVRDIIADVKERGDIALLELSRK